MPLLSGTEGESVSAPIFVDSPSNEPKKLIRHVSPPFFVGPGMHLAQSSVWLACAKSLAVLNIEKYVDGSGKVVEPKMRYSGGTIR